jgi:ribonuclease M5
LRRLAEQAGTVILSDSDGAGFVIRNYLKGALPKDRVKHAYIRTCRVMSGGKRRPGREVKISVEAMPPEIIVEAQRRAGATFLDEKRSEAAPQAAHKVGLLPATRLSGRPYSRKKGSRSARAFSPRSGSLLQRADRSAESAL